MVGGVYTPLDYDERYHGPVRLREALGSSLNVPAVWTANELGPERIVERLRELGVTTLNQDASYYGPAIALGDGEVSLLELTNAYATIARAGEWKPVITVKSVRAKGAGVILPPAAARTAGDAARRGRPPRRRPGRSRRARIRLRVAERARAPLPGGGEDGDVEGVPRQLDGRLHPRGDRRGVGGEFRRVSEGGGERDH